MNALFGNDFFVQRCRYSKYIFIDGTFHVPPEFTQFLIFMYYDVQIEKKIPAFFILTNSKTEVSYDHIFKTIKEILSFGDINFKLNFITVTTDNEDALNNSLYNNFNNIKRIFCFFHHKQILERNEHKMGFCKKEFLADTKTIIDRLGILPLIYNGNIETINNIIDELKTKNNNHYYYLESFI